MSRRHIDKLGGRGNSGETTTGGNTTGRLFSQILIWLSDPNRRAIVIGATNMPKMDEAFTREGRFDVLIPMLSPDVEARHAILDVHLNKVRKVTHDITSDQLLTIAKMTDDWKGNMLEELIKRAVRIAFIAGKDVVSFEDLKAAYDDYIVNNEALKKTEALYVKLANELCNSKRFLETVQSGTAVGGGRYQAMQRAKPKVEGMPE